MIKEDKVERCPACGMSDKDWTANEGQGVMQSDKLFCCEGCANGLGCTCVKKENLGKTVTGHSMDPGHLKIQGPDNQ